MARLEKVFFAVVVLSLVVWSVPSAFSQAVFGNITGTVTDPSGAAVPNAAVTITDIDRGTSYTTKTTSVGNYTQTHLLAGHYRVKVTAAGFSDFTANADVQVDATTRVDAQVQVGKAASTVAVTGEMSLDRKSTRLNSCHMS